MGSWLFSSAVYRMLRHGFLAFSILGAGLLAACGPRPTPTPTSTAIVAATETLTPTVTATSTITSTLTPTATNTFLPTPTLTSTMTPTVTETPLPSITPTPTGTPAPSDPAQLFYYVDASGQRVNWSYAQMSYYAQDVHGQTRYLSATLAFQLMDRAIHWATYTIMDRPVTVYYLAVSHDFGGGPVSMRLILGGADGQDVNISDIPAGGNRYISVRQISYRDSFDPIGFHRDINLPYAQRVKLYPDVLLADFQNDLAVLPPQVILLADQAVMVDPASWHQVQNDISSVAYLAAQALPFFEVDPYNRVVGPSRLAQSLEAYFLHHVPPGALVSTYSAKALVIISKP